MKNILCYGDSNTWGAKPLVKLGGANRYSYDVRWTTVMQRDLGEGYYVVAEGLGGRTTTFDDPIMGDHKNGKRFLFTCLESHTPLDLVIIMLGTNDLKACYNLSPWVIANAAGSLVNIVNNPSKPLYGGKPKTLLVAPPPLEKLDVLAGAYEGGTEKSLHLAEHFKTVAENCGSDYLDAGQIVTSSDVDGVHFTEDQLRPLGLAMAAKVREILS